MNAEAPAYDLSYQDSITSITAVILSYPLFYTPGNHIGRFSGHSTAFRVGQAR